MRVLPVLALVLAFAAPAYAQPADAPKPAPKTCHDADGKPVKCAPPKPRKKRGEGMTAQSFTRCRDVRTHMATKCGGPYAEPLPTD